jgi:tetratricopeptide (TPR) repeat protein
MNAVVRYLATLVAALPVVASAQVVLPPDLGVGRGSGPRPTPLYDAGLAALASGEFTAALQLAKREYASARQVGTQRWIDSIPPAVLVGECHDELGDLSAALTAYEEALLLWAVHAEWLRQVQFSPQPPDAAPVRPVATWGRSRRNAPQARLPDTAAIRVGTTDAQKVLEQGGVLAAPHDRLIRPLEIMRPAVIALYRSAVILGPLAHESTTIDSVVKAVGRRQAPPTHYSQSWIDVAHGMGLWAQGKPDLARPLLERGLLMGDRFDNPLAAWALLALGRIALDADRLADAAGLFEEATYTAADHGDLRALEEAFRLAHDAQLAGGARRGPPWMSAARQWAAANRGVVPVLRGRLHAMQAECLAAAGDDRSAEAALQELKEIDPRLLRGDAGRGALGAEAGYARALATYCLDGSARGDTELETAIALARGRSPRLWQLGRVVELVAAGETAIADRRAQEMLGRLLGPQPARSMALDPLGTLALVTSAQPEAHEMLVGLSGRRGPDAALDAAEQATRHRWQAARGLGGRRVALERLLEAPAATLPEPAAVRRAALIAARPELAAALERMARLRAGLAASLAQPALAGPGGRGGGERAWTEYTEAADRRARQVALIAAGRDAVPDDVPPLDSSATIRGRLRPGQLILSFHWSGTGLTGVLESRDRVAVWEVRQAAGLQREVEQLARGLGLFDAATVTVDRLQAGDWPGSIERIERALFENSRVSLAEGIDELVIVPDGWLWYVPFELLPASTTAVGPDAPRLHDVCRVRYAPTRSLAVAGRPARMSGPIGVHVGRMARSDKPAAAAGLLEQLVAAADRTVPLTFPASIPPALVTGMCDALALFDESSADAAEGGILLPGAGSRPPITFTEWLEPPAKRPQVVLLPGLQTAMANGFTKTRPSGRPGEELFMTAVDLMAAGSSTAVLARWRVGGGSTVDLMTEFLRDVTAIPQGRPRPPASESWRRAVDLVTAERPDLDREPRLKPHSDTVLTDGRHPFFWAGYLLVDSGLPADSGDGAVP